MAWQGGRFPARRSLLSSRRAGHSTRLVTGALHFLRLPILVMQSANDSKMHCERGKLGRGPSFKMIDLDQ